MKPKIKQKRIDPRYFLNETIDRDKLEEIASPKRDDDNKGPKKKKKEQTKPLPKDLFKKKPPKAVPSGSEEELDKRYRKKEHGRVGDKDNDGIPDEKDGPDKKLLKGEKSLYEKIRGAIEEAFDEYLEENK